MRIAILSGLICVLGLPVFAQPELKGKPADLEKYLAGVRRVVTVTGEGEVKAPADEAVVSLRVVTESRSLQEALRANQDARARLVAQLGKQGIGADRIQASKFSSTPKFGLFGEKAKSYRVENVVKVKARDEKELQAIAGAVDAGSEVQLAGMEFQQTDKEAHKRQAIVQACENAADRKKLFEEKLGLRLTPRAFSGGRVMQHPLPVGLQGGTAPSFRGKTLSDSALPQEAAEAARVEENVSAFGELVYRVEITVEYEVAGQ
jgi:uncharacterized protein YggE